MIARVAAVAALVPAIVVVALVVLGGSTTYTLHADFVDAGGLVTGDEVLMGPAQVGSVQSISLTPNGQAQVKMSIDSDAAPVREGTVARIYENSLSGIANKYVVLEPAARRGARDPRRRPDHLRSHLLVRQPRPGVRRARPAHARRPANVIKGEAASIKGKSAQANQTLKYLAPGLSAHQRRDRRA